MTHIRTDPYSIVLTYYEGTQGPTILMDVRERETLAKLRDLLMKLSRGERQDVELLKEPWVEAYDINGLLLDRLDNGTERRLTLRKSSRTNSSFQWSRDAEGWLESAELIDGLLDGDGPGHQYLAEGDALVELDFMENL